MRNCDTPTLLGEVNWYAWFIGLFDCFTQHKGVSVLSRYPESVRWPVATNFKKDELQRLLHRRLTALFGKSRANAIARGWD